MSKTYFPPWRTGPWLHRAALLGVALGMACGMARPAAADDQPWRAQVPFQAVGIGVTPLWVAVDLGLFKKYGIDATTQFVSQSPTLVAAVLSGETPFANVGEDAVISADLNGGDIVILVSGPERLVFQLNAQPSLHKVADLKGKKIGISQFGATTDFIARYVLTKAGLNPKTDADILPTGPQAANLAALQQRLIDAAVLAPPVMIKAQQLGFAPVTDMLDDDLAFYTSALVGKRSWIVAHHDETMAAVKAYVAGSAVVHTNKSAAEAAIAKYSDLHDPAVLDASYALLIRALPKVPEPKVDAMRTGLTQKTDAAAKTADPAQFIDPSFVQELQRTGFIDQLYK